MVDKIELREHVNQIWGPYELYKNEEYVATMERYIDISSDFITEYEITGGHDEMHKGQMKRRFDISKCEFIHTKC